MTTGDVRPCGRSPERARGLHQLYQVPAGALVAQARGRVWRIGPEQAFWARAGVPHRVRVEGGHRLHRIDLCREPAALRGFRAGVVRVSPTAAALVQELEGGLVPPRDEATVMAGIGVCRTVADSYAVRVARVLDQDPADPTDLQEWARRLHISAKTLQRDFAREFGMPYSRWRTRSRLLAARDLLGQAPVAQVAARVGYSSPSAFIAAFAREFGVTPGRVEGGAR